MARIIIVIESKSGDPYEYWDDFEIAIQNIFTNLDPYAPGDGGNNYQYRIHPSNPVVGDDLDKEKPGYQGRVLDALDQEIEKLKDKTKVYPWEKEKIHGLEKAREIIIRDINAF